MRHLSLAGAAGHVSRWPVWLLVVIVRRVRSGTGAQLLQDIGGDVLSGLRRAGGGAFGGGRHPWWTIVGPVTPDRTGW